MTRAAISKHAYIPPTPVAWNLPFAQSCGVLSRLAAKGQLPMCCLQDRKQLPAGSPQICDIWIQDPAESCSCWTICYRCCDICHSDEQTHMAGIPFLNSRPTKLGSSSQPLILKYRKYCMCIRKKLCIYKIYMYIERELRERER